MVLYQGSVSPALSTSVGLDANVDANAYFLICKTELVRVGVPLTLSDAWVAPLAVQRGELLKGDLA